MSCRHLPSLTANALGILYTFALWTAHRHKVMFVLLLGLVGLGRALAT